MANPYNAYGISDDEYNDYGAEFIDLVDKVAAGRARQAEQTAQRASKNAFLAQLDMVAPQWREKNNHPEFLRDIQAPVTPGGETIHQALHRAFYNQDVSATAGIFNAWSFPNKGEIRQMPDGYLYRGNPGSAQAPLLTRKQIDHHYSEVTKGRVSEEEKKAFEALLARASREGRIG